MYYYRWFCMLTHINVQHIMCCDSVVLFPLVIPLLQGSLDCPPFLIAPSVFSNAYSIVLIVF